jgi:hypothetical protein
MRTFAAAVKTSFGSSTNRPGHNTRGIRGFGRRSRHRSGRNRGDTTFLVRHDRPAVGRGRAERKWTVSLLAPRSVWPRPLSLVRTQRHTGRIGAFARGVNCCRKWTLAYGNWSLSRRWLGLVVVLRRRRMTYSSSLSLVPPVWFRLSRRYDVGDDAVPAAVKPSALRVLPLVEHVAQLTK